MVLYCGETRRIKLGRAGSESRPPILGFPEGQLPLQQRSSLLGGTQVAQPERADRLSSNTEGMFWRHSDLLH